MTMKNITFIFLTFLAFSLGSCEQDVMPKADFETDFAIDYNYLQSNKNNIPRYSTFEPIKFIDKSINGVKYSWDFGDGQVSMDKEPTIHYTKGGEYTVTLSLQSETGNTSVLTKQIKIYERVIEKISISFSGWDHNLYNLEELGWTEDKVSDIVLEIGVLGLHDYLIPSTILYTSDTIKDVSIESPVISIFPQNDIVIDYYLLFVQDEPRPAYVVLLSAIDENGKHLFYSSEDFPGLSCYLDDNTGLYKLKSGATIDIECVFK